jgi:ornithine carbamoyltransferase
MPEPETPRLAKKDFLSILDLAPRELDACLDLAARLKRARALGRSAPTSGALAGRHVALLFEKPSLRTRSTFEIAIRELGGEVLEPQQESAFGVREPLTDVARNLERWVSGVVIRTFAHEALVEFAAAAPRLHVVNALSDTEHPCQALADILTLQEHWERLPGSTLAYIGDGNNVATSLVHASAMMGVHVRIGSPRGYEVPGHVIDDARRIARHGARIESFEDPREAVRGAAAVYTDVWTSMGKEAAAAERRSVFAPYQVNSALMDQAGPGALFMHCLPAHRGEEVTDEVMDSPASVVFDQAENRLHTQKAMLLMLMGERA